MNSFWSRIIISTTLQNKKRDHLPDSYSDYELARGYRRYHCIFA